jgi:hypothetical protein
MKQLLKQLMRNPEQFVEFVLDDELTLREKSETVLDYITWPFRECYKRLQHCMTWLPIIWNDKDWDYNYLLIMMHKKFSSMAEYSETHGHLMCSEKNAKEMRYLAHILKRFIDDTHCEHELNAHRDKHPIQWIESELENGWKTSQLIISDEDSKTYRKIFLKKDRMQKEELLRFTDLFRRKILHYWD